MSTLPNATEFEKIERARVRALLDCDIALARELHADHYELVTPLGATLSKEQYLGALADGTLRYRAWDIEPPMKVRVYAEIAMVRYQVALEVVMDGREIPRARYWHTDIYENRDGQWKAVWSQATRIERAAI